MATCVDLAGAKYPTEYNGQKITPLEGKSLRAGVRRQADRARRDLLGARREQGDPRQNWKLVPRATGPWELYDLDKDRGETKDLAALHPKWRKTWPPSGRPGPLARLVD